MVLRLTIQDTCSKNLFFKKKNAEVIKLVIQDLEQKNFRTVKGQNESSLTFIPLTR